jgi:hypothetical protein
MQQMKKNKYIKSIIVFLLISMPLGFVFAQSRQSSLDSMIVIDISKYKPTVVDANKINDSPTISDSTKKIPVAAYSINSKRIITGFDVAPISPAQMVGEPLTKLYNGLMKLGMGTYTTPYGEFWLNNLRSKDASYGLRLKHLSSSSTLKGYGYSGFNDDEISLYGKKFLKEHTLLGNFDYSNNGVHFYGYDASMNSLSKDATLQRFNLFSGNAELVSHYADPKRFNHDVQLSYYNLADKYNASENNVKTNGYVQTAIGKELLKVNGVVDFYNYKNQKDTVNNTIVTINPNFIASGDKYHASIGFTATMDNFVKSKFYFYPNVDVSYNVIDNIIIPYAGITGGLQKNSFKTFTDQNPFVLSELTMLNSNKKYEIYGGIKGTLSSTTSFNARASYSSIDNMALFVNNTLLSSQNKFDVIYDDATLLNVHGEVSYQQIEKLRINLHGDYFNYKMKTEQRAWYKPQVEIGVSSNYNLREKIVAKVDLFYVDNQFAKSIVGTDMATITTSVVTQLKGVFDANIGLEYRYTKKLGFFVNFNNIANYRYYRWSNYPTQLFSLMGGLSYSF